MARTHDFDIDAYRSGRMTRLDENAHAANTAIDQRWPELSRWSVGFTV